jgi:hypothetical protein
MTESKEQGFQEQICNVCQVKIMPAIGGDLVNFSYGPAGTRATLWQRVCQHVQRPGCINPNPNSPSPQR